MLRRWTLDEIEFIKNNYLTIGAAACGKVLNRTATAIHHKTEKLKIIHVKRKVEQMLFTEIRDCKIAYWLGLMWADGYIVDYSIGLSLAKKDMDEISSIMTDFGDWKEYIRHPQNPNHKIVSMFRIGDTFLRNFLIENDYKTKSTVSPTKILSKIPNELHNYFWRGFFDGDGCIFIHTKGNYNHGVITLAGSYRQDWSDFEKLLEQLQIKYKLKRIIGVKGHKCSKVTISNKKDLKHFCEYIYKNTEQANIGFTRKYIKYKKFLEVENFRIASTNRIDTDVCN